MWHSSMLPEHLWFHAIVWEERSEHIQEGDLMGVGENREVPIRLRRDITTQYSSSLPRPDFATVSAILTNFPTLVMKMHLQGKGINIVLP